MSFDNLPYRRDGAVAVLPPNVAQIFDTLSLPRIDEPLQLAVSCSRDVADVSQWHTASGQAFESGR